jgi:hypothetical protein
VAGDEARFALAQLPQHRVERKIFRRRTARDFTLAQI